LGFVPVVNIASLFYDLLTVVMVLIFVEILVSNLICYGVKISPYSPFVRTLRGIVNPILNPLRKVLPHPARTLNLDFASMIALVILQVVRGAIY